MAGLCDSDASMATVDEEKTVMCFCASRLRPMFLSMTPLNDCMRCGGTGWVGEHEFTGDDVCTVCGFSKVAHWENAKEE